MTDARNVAFELKVARQALLEWGGAGQPIDRILQETMREHRVGSGQRAAISRSVYDFVRYWPIAVDHPIRPQNPEWLRDFDARLREHATDAKFDFNARHQKMKPTFEADPSLHFARVHGLRPFMLKETVPAPQAWHAFLHQMLVEAPLTVRVNPLKISAQKFLETYEKIGARASDWLPHSFHFDRRWALNQDPGFEAGHFEVQDEHSQLVSLVADPQPGETVLDMCAGGGGKTLHLAAMMEGKGEITAYDIAKRKLTDLTLRARRAGFGNIRVAADLPRAQFDLVVVDAPCSGLGTLRRNPDRLYTFDEAEAKRLLTVQSDLLNKAFERLKPGGRLVYATCTVRPQENVLVLKRALTQAAAAKFSLNADLRVPLKKSLGPQTDSFLTAAAATPSARLTSSPELPLPSSCLQLGPSSHSSGGLVGDGFFVALVK